MLRPPQHDKIKMGVTPSSVEGGREPNTRSLSLRSCFESLSMVLLLINATNLFPLRRSPYDQLGLNANGLDLYGSSLIFIIHLIKISLGNGFTHVHTVLIDSS